MPIIMLEGIDGAGKTTLVDRIAKSAIAQGFTPRVIHRGPLNDTVTNELIRPLFAVADDELLICDRWHVGELIYGPIYRGESQVRQHEAFMEELLILLDVVPLIISAPISEIRRRLEERGEDYLKDEHVETVHEAYLNHAFTYGWEIVDTSFPLPDWMVDQWVRIATSHREAVHAQG